MGDAWTAGAEEFAEAIREHGFAAAALTASAWQAGVDPDATRSLLAAASVLTGGDAVTRAWDRVPACPAAGDFLAGAEEVEGETAAAASFAERTARDCAEALEAAVEARARARRATAAASAQGNAAKAAVAAEERRAARAIADCDAALEVLALAGEALRRAGLLLLRVPAEFEETYEEPLRYAASGRKLPWNGAFITPGTTETITERGAA